MKLADLNPVHATVWRPDSSDTPYDWQYFTWTHCHPDCEACAEEHDACA